LFHQWNAQFPAEKQARHLAVLPQVASITSKQFSQKQIFVKVEALLKRHDPNWAPRIIYQSSDIHNVVLGPVMQACTKRMFGRFESSSHSGVSYFGAYGKSSDQIAARIERHGTSETVFVESDFSSNDMTQLRDVHILEVAWLQWLGAPLWITSLMLHANAICVSAHKHGLRARIENQLPTGAQSTTFRNTLWNATINHAFCLRVKAEGDVLVLGDDMLMRYDNPMSSRYQQIRREYEYVTKLAGMDAKVKVRRFLCECSFLSKSFIPTDLGHVMAPLLGKAVARYNARASVNEAVSDRSYLAGKSLSYAFEFRHVPPIARVFLLRYEQLAPDGDVSLDALGWNAKGAFLSRGVKGVLRAISGVTTVASRDDMTRFYHMKYGMTSTDILENVIAIVFGIDDLDEISCARLLEDFV
jgi:hypothetical protein